MNWWEEDDLLGVARSSSDGYSIVLINRGYEARSISNALDWAGLPTSGTYVDQLTQTAFSPNGDELSVTVPARGSLLLTWEE